MTSRKSFASNTRIKKILLRILLYIIGLFFLALGTSVSINSKLGISAVNSIPYVLSLITNQNQGLMVIIVFSIFILLQILILKKDFKIINLTQIIFSTIFGFLVNFTNTLVKGFFIPTYIGQLFMLFISILLIAFGVTLFVSTNLINMPMEGLVAAVNKVYLPQKPFGNVKQLLDTVVVVIAALLSLLFLHGLYGVREGTIISALLIGKFMNPIQRLLKPKIDRLCF